MGRSPAERDLPKRNGLRQTPLRRKPRPARPRIVYPVIRGRCAYCANAKAVQRDHVIPYSLAQKYPHIYAFLPERLKVLVPACITCNINKGTRRLVPPHLADLIPDLAEAYPGTPWRVWSGDPSEPAFKDVHV